MLLSMFIKLNLISVIHYEELNNHTKIPTTCHYIEIFRQRELLSIVRFKRYHHCVFKHSARGTYLTGTEKRYW